MHASILKIQLLNFAKIGGGQGGGGVPLATGSYVSDKER